MFGGVQVADIRPTNVFSLSHGRKEWRKKLKQTDLWAAHTHTRIESEARWLYVRASAFSVEAYSRHERGRFLVDPLVQISVQARCQSVCVPLAEQKRLSGKSKWLNLSSICGTLGEEKGYAVPKPPRFYYWVHSYTQFCSTHCNSRRSPNSCCTVQKSAVRDFYCYWFFFFL